MYIILLSPRSNTEYFNYPRKSPTNIPNHPALPPSTTMQTNTILISVTKIHSECQHDALTTFKISMSLHMLNGMIKCRWDER